MGLIFNTETIKTSNLVLRKLTLKDAQGIFDIRSNIKTTYYSGIKPYEDISRAENFITKIINEVELGNVSFWGITLIGKEDYIIGTICLMPYENKKNIAEIGYELNKNYTGIGIMTEGIKAVLEYCKTNLKLDYVYADTNIDNIPSLKLLERFNFTQSEKKTSNNFKYYYLKL